MEHMQDITDLMLNYRECVRSTWNTYFRDGYSSDFWDTEDALFRALVSRQLVWTDEKCMHGKLKSYLHVVPTLGPKGAPLLWAREEPDGRSWIWSEVTLETPDIELHLIDYFDWDERGYRDYQYYRTRIISYPANPPLVGADVLIEVWQAKIYFYDRQSSPPQP